MFAKWARDFQPHTNQLPLFDQQRSNQAGGDPNIRYFHSYWAVPPGMALVITFSPPVPCQSWNFQLNNHWMESLDYRYHKVHTNSVLAAPDHQHAPTTAAPAAGTPTDPVSFTLIVAHHPPHHPSSVSEAYTAAGAAAGVAAGAGGGAGGGGVSASNRHNWLTTAGHDCGTM
jgi:hypothetical protein